MLNRPSCTLSFFVARTDVSFMMHTIPHLVRMANYPFSKKIIFVDSKDLKSDKKNRANIGTLEEVRDKCKELQDQNIIDEIIDFDYTHPIVAETYRKYFEKNLRHTHNWKGYPVYGNLFAIENCDSDYLLHFDSDILMYQDNNFSWVDASMKIMGGNCNIVTTRPLAGPSEKSSPGYHLSQTFGSRCYLIHTKRLKQILPLPLLVSFRRTRILDSFPQRIKKKLYLSFEKGELDSWELMVGAALRKNRKFRAILSSDKAWTLHPKDHGEQFIRLLPEIIQRIEHKDFPLEQEKKYDLDLNLWTR